MEMVYEELLNKLGFFLTQIGRRLLKSLNKEERVKLLTAALEEAVHTSEQQL